LITIHPASISFPAPPSPYSIFPIKGS